MEWLPWQMLATGVFVLGVDGRSGTVAGIPEDKTDAVVIWLLDCHDLIVFRLCFVESVKFR